jgi:hypothetical protein
MGRYGNPRFTVVPAAVAGPRCPFISRATLRHGMPPLIGPASRGRTRTDWVGDMAVDSDCRQADPKYGNGAGRRCW